MSIAASAACGSTFPRAAQSTPAAMEFCTPLQAGTLGRPAVDRAALEKHMDQVFDWGRNDAPGVAVMVLHEGGVVAQRQYGLASIEHGVAFTPNHVVRLPYSEGREFIAITAALMEHDGLIRLDDRVRDYFPRLPSWSSPVRIRDLIHHRSGFVDEWEVLLMMHGSMANRFDESQFLRLLYEQPAPEVEPVSGYMYSNSDYGLLRLILERSAGGDLESYMKRRIFEPLGMHSTRLVDDFASVGPRDAVFYEPRGDGYRHSIQVKTSPGARYVIATTACDLGRWAVAHSDPSSEISGAVARLMVGATPVPALDGHYTFGHTVTDVHGTRVLRHEGVLMLNYLTRIPELGYSVITFGGRGYDPDENRAIVRYLLDAGDQPRPEFATEPVPVTAQELERYGGRYLSTNVQAWDSHTLERQEVHVTATADGLVARHPWADFELVPVGPGRFSWRGKFFATLVEFDAGEGDGPLTMKISFDDGTPSEAYIRLREWAPSAELLRRVAGRYHNAHLDYYWTLLVNEEGGLVLRAPTLADTKVEPYQENEFLLRHEKYPGLPARFWIRFHENERGEVTHLTVWNPRLMHHRFDRVDRGGGQNARPD